MTRPREWPGRRLLCAALVAAMFAPPLVAAETIGRVAETSGTVVRIKAAGAPELLGGGSPLATGDVIETQANSGAELRYGDGTVVRLAAASRFTVPEYRLAPQQAGEERFVSRLLAGAMRVVTGTIAKRQPRNARFVAHTATIGIRGTDFTVRMCETECELADSATVARAGQAEFAGRVGGSARNVFAVDGAGRVRPLAVSAPVNAGDIVAASDGVAVLVMRDQTTISLDPGTALAIREFRYDEESPANARVELALLVGRVQVATGHLAKTHPERFRFFVGDLPVRVHGTIFGAAKAAASNAAGAAGDAAQNAGNTAQNTADQTAEAARNAASEGGEAARNAGNTAQNTAGQTAEAARNTADEGGEAARIASGQTNATADSLANRGRQVASDARNTAEAGRKEGASGAGREGAGVAGRTLGTTIGYYAGTAAGTAKGAAEGASSGGVEGAVEGARRGADSGSAEGAAAGGRIGESAGKAAGETVGGKVDNVADDVAKGGRQVASDARNTAEAGRKEGASGAGREGAGVAGRTLGTTIGYYAGTATGTAKGAAEGAASGGVEGAVEGARRGADSGSAEGAAAGGRIGESAGKAAGETVGGKVDNVADDVAKGGRQVASDARNTAEAGRKESASGAGTSVDVREGAVTVGSGNTAIRLGAGEMAEDQGGRIAKGSGGIKFVAPNPGLVAVADPGGFFGQPAAATGKPAAPGVYVSVNDGAVALAQGGKEVLISRGEAAMAPVGGGPPVKVRNGVRVTGGAGLGANGASAAPGAPVCEAGPPAKGGTSLVATAAGIDLARLRPNSAIDGKLDANAIDPTNTRDVNKGGGDGAGGAEGLGGNRFGLGFGGNTTLEDAAKGTGGQLGRGGLDGLQSNRVVTGRHGDTFAGNALNEGVDARNFGGGGNGGQVSSEGTPLLNAPSASSGDTTVPLTQGDSVGVSGGVASGNVMAASRHDPSSFRSLVQGAPSTHIKAFDPNTKQPILSSPPVKIIKLDGTTRPVDDPSGGGSGVPIYIGAGQFGNEIRGVGRAVGARAGAAGGSGDGRTDQQGGGGETGGVAMQRGEQLGIERAAASAGSINWDAALQINEVVNPGRQ